MEYRFDGLDPAASYRLGLLTYDLDSAVRRMDVVLRRASDQQQTVIARSVVAPSGLRGEAPAVQWFDVPKGAVDPQGTVVAVCNAAGGNATVAELWIAQKAER